MVGTTGVFRGTVITAASALALLTLTACGSNDPQETAPGQPNPSPAADNAAPQPGRIVKQLTIKFGRSQAGYGADSSAHWSGADGTVECRGDSVEIHVAKANNGPATVTVSRDGRLVLTQNHEKVGQQQAELPNVGAWNGNVVQLKGESQAVVWELGDGTTDAIQIDGSIQCGVAPAPVTTTSR